MKNPKTSATLHENASRKSKTSAALHGNMFLVGMIQIGLPKRVPKNIPNRLLNIVLDVYWSPIEAPELRTRKNGAAQVGAEERL